MKGKRRVCAMKENGKALNERKAALGMPKRRDTENVESSSGFERQTQGKGCRGH